jgi:phosphoserine aminotransferase
MGDPGGASVNSGVPTPPSGLPPGVWSFAVGPSQLHACVPDGIQRALSEGLPSWSHRSEAFRREVARTVEALGTLLEIPSGYRVLFLGSATEAMERVIQGLVGGEGPDSPRSFHLLNGDFARRFRTISRNLGGAPDGVEAPDGEGFALSDVRVPEGFDLLCMTQNETSTGVALDPEGLSRLAERHPNVLSVVDAVTATPLLPLDLKRVDGMFFSVQKLFGLPAGLGVLVVAPRLVERARERLARGVSVGGYMHLPALATSADRHETGPTPNMLGIRLLGDVAEAFLREGMDPLRQRAKVGAARIHQAAAQAGWTPFPPCPADRSGTVLVLRVAEAGGGGAARARLRSRGFEISSGYGALKDDLVRIANFPAHSPEAVEALARAIEQG